MQERNDDIDLNEVFKEFDRIMYWASAAVLIILTAFYFILPFLTFISAPIKTFSEAVITNIIPTTLIVCFSYALLRRFQAIRSRYDQQILVEKVTQSMNTSLDQKLGNLSDSVGQIKYRLDEMQDELEVISARRQLLLYGSSEQPAVYAVADPASILGSQGKLKNPQPPKTRSKQEIRRDEK